MGKKIKDNLVIIYFLTFLLIFSFSNDVIDKVNDLIDSKKYEEAKSLLIQNKEKIGLSYYTTLAIIYAHQKRNYQEILELAKKRFVDNINEPRTKDQNFSKILYTYGYIEYYIKNNIYNTEIYLNESLKYNSENTDTLITLAQLYYDRNEIEKSEEFLDKTFEILNKQKKINEKFLKLYNQILLENKRYAKIIKIMEPYIDKYPITKLFYAKALTFLGEYLQANKIIKEYMNINNDNLEAYYILGLTYKDSRVKSKEGIDLIEKLNKEKNDRYYLKLAQFYEGIGDVEMAINYYDKTLQLNKNNDKYYILAITYAIDNGNTAKAINWAFDYYNKKPSDFNANLFLAMCYEYQKQFENSKKYYYQAMNIDPSRYEPYVRLAWIVLEQESDFNTSAEILLKGFNNAKDIYYKNRFKKALKDLIELEEEFKKKFKEKTGQEISKPIKPELKERIMEVIKN